MEEKDLLVHQVGSGLKTTIGDLRQMLEDEIKTLAELPEAESESTVKHSLALAAINETFTRNSMLVTQNIQKIAAEQLAVVSSFKNLTNLFRPEMSILTALDRQMEPVRHFQQILATSVFPKLDFSKALRFDSVHKALLAASAPMVDISLGFSIESMDVIDIPPSFKFQFWEESTRQFTEAFAVLEVDLNDTDEFYREMSWEQLRDEASAVRWIKTIAHQRRMHEKESVDTLKEMLSSGRLSSNTLHRFIHLIIGIPTASTQVWIPPEQEFELRVNDPDLGMSSRTIMRAGKQGTMIGISTGHIAESWQVELPKPLNVTEQSIEKRGIKAGTSERVTEFHRLVKSGMSQRQAKNQAHCDPSTYYQWCTQVTGEEPILPYR